MDIDCLQYIFSYLPLQHRQQCRRVCHRWKFAADYLMITQKSVKIIAKQYQEKESQCSKVIIWPRCYLRFTTFTSILEQFPNLNQLLFHGIDQWCDPMITVLTESCPKLTKLEFISSSGIGGNRWGDFFFHCVTDRGWNQLVASYGQQLQMLTLNDCDIDDHHLEVIINGFTQLTYLDIMKNSAIRNGSALKNLGNRIKILKVGSDLNSGETHADLLLSPIANGNGRNVQELHISGILSPQIHLLSQFKSLEVLSIRYFKAFHDLDHTDYFSVICTLKNLRNLELYQVQCNDGFMDINGQQLMSIFRCCPFMVKLTITSDIWCESSFTDTIIRLLVENCPKLEELTLSPGNCMVTDGTLEVLSKLHLKSLSLSSFPSITDNGLVNLLIQCKSLTLVKIDDCASITPKIINDIILLGKSNPLRRISLSFNECDILREHIPLSIPQNLVISVSNKTIPLPDQSQIRTLPSMVNMILSVISLVVTAMAISITLTIYFVHQFVFEHFASMALLLMSLLTTVAAVPVGLLLFSIHSYIGDIITSGSIIFRYYNNNYLYQNEPPDGEVLKWNSFDQIIDWFVNLLST